MKIENYAWAVNLSGWLALGAAAIQTILVQIGLMNGHPFEPAVAGEIILMAVFGIVTSVLARCLKLIEARLTRIEGAQPPSSS
jgi:hypothetical protein